jgi:hypothetical protein
MFRSIVSILCFPFFKMLAFVFLQAISGNSHCSALVPLTLSFCSVRMRCQRGTVDFSLFCACPSNTSFCSVRMRCQRGTVEFSLFCACPSNKHCPSVLCACAANVALWNSRCSALVPLTLPSALCACAANVAVGTDVDILALGAVSLNADYAQNVNKST